MYAAMAAEVERESLSSPPAPDQKSRFDTTPTAAAQSPTVTENQRASRHGSSAEAAALAGVPLSPADKMKIELRQRFPSPARDAERAVANASAFCQEAVVRTRVRDTYEGMTRRVMGQAKARFPSPTRAAESYVPSGSIGVGPVPAYCGPATSLVDAPAQSWSDSQRLRSSDTSTDTHTAAHTVAADSAAKSASPQTSWPVTTRDAEAAAVALVAQLEASEKSRRKKLSNTSEVADRASASRAHTGGSLQEQRDRDALHADEARRELARKERAISARLANPVGAARSLSNSQVLLCGC